MIHKLSPEACEVCRRLQDAGHAAYVVGGAVRDIVNGDPPGDFDIATSATPEQVMQTFRRVVPTGIKHGTVTVLVRSLSIEVTTFRTESAYTDRRRPDAVEFVSSIEDDLARRDFTVNGLALDPVNAKFVDPFGGVQDLKARIVRAIGRPQDRLSEDALRVLRAIRFAAQLEADIEPATLAAVCAAAPALAGVSPERVRDEILKMLASRCPSRGFRVMKATGVLSIVLPELAEGVDVEQRGAHRFDVFEHSIRSCDSVNRDRPTLRLAALFHDVGKPRALQVDENGNRTFHGHDAISVTMTSDLLRRLRFPNSTIERVGHLIGQHMFAYSSQWTDAAVRRFIARVGEENIDDLLLLREADSAAQTGDRPDLRGLAAMRAHIGAVLNEQRLLTRSDLKVNGHDLQEAGIPRGPVMGAVIDHLFESVLDDPALNTTDRLLEIASRFYATRIRDAGGS